jgi:hypothetical protein
VHESTLTLINDSTIHPAVAVAAAAESVNLIEAGSIGIY